MADDVDMAQWLRQRPNQTDDPDEFVHDFALWAEGRLKQDGFYWPEFAWFCERAIAMNARRCRFKVGAMKASGAPVLDDDGGGDDNET